jgi:hypothetical protein
MKRRELFQKAFLRVPVARFNRELADWAHENRYEVLRDITR